MTKRKPIESYSDVLSQLAMAVTHGGLRLNFPTCRAAVAHRHRLYRARVAYFDATQNPQYNDVYIQLMQGDEIVKPGALKAPEAPAHIVLQLHSKRAMPAMTDLDGNPIESKTAEELDADPLTAAAQALKLKLLGE